MRKLEDAALVFAQTENLPSAGVLLALRRKLARLAAMKRSRELGLEMARRRISEHGRILGFVADTFSEEYVRSFELYLSADANNASLLKHSLVNNFYNLIRPIIVNRFFLVETIHQIPRELGRETNVPTVERVFPTTEEKVLSSSAHETRNP